MSRSHQPRKRFGQNFLRDDHVVQKILAAVHAEESDHVLEIGPGQGALTDSLARTGCRLDVIELDRDLVPGLLAAFSIYPHFRLHNTDALKFDVESLVNAGEKLRVVGNLPYNISTPLIFKLLEKAATIEDMHFMLQLEVVERLAAGPGSKHRGRLGIMAQYLCRVEHLFNVPPEAFHPPPRVQSAVVRLTPWQESPWPDCDQIKLQNLVQVAFTHRRKTLRNNLKGLIDSTGLERLGVDPGARPETLELDDFIKITNTLHG